FTPNCPVIFFDRSCVLIQPHMSLCPHTESICAAHLQLQYRLVVVPGFIWRLARIDASSATVCSRILRINLDSFVEVGKRASHVGITTKRLTSLKIRQPALYQCCTVFLVDLKCIGECFNSLVVVSILVETHSSVITFLGICHFGIAALSI